MILIESIFVLLMNPKCLICNQHDFNIMFINLMEDTVNTYNLNKESRKKKRKFVSRVRTRLIKLIIFIFFIFKFESFD